MAINPIDIYVGQRLRKMRKIRGWSQNTLGKKIGVTFQQLQKYELGVNRIGSSRLWDLRNALGVEIQDFFKGVVEWAESAGYDLREVHRLANPSNDCLDPINRAETEKLIKLYYDIEPETVRKIVFKIVRAFGDDEALQNPS